MKIIENRNSLSEEDIGLLKGTNILTKMLKNRILVKFDSSDVDDELYEQLYKSEDFYYMQYVETNTYSFWFHSAIDFDNFKSFLVALKLMNCKVDK